MVRCVYVYVNVFPPPILPSIGRMPCASARFSDRFGFVLHSQCPFKMLSGSLNSLNA